MQPFVISIKGLKPGKSHFEWHAGAEFFEAFGNSEITDADLRVAVDFHYSDHSAQVQCTIDGIVAVVCDRCLERLDLPVSTSFSLEDEDMDLSADVDLSQDIYDFVCISLPMQRVHPEGECDMETTKFICE